MKDKALDLLKDYWGGMIEKGANTFWEVYDKNDPRFSPYGNYLINSYCHSWSSTPAYFFRKYFN
jgi:alpha-L-rhamnosidase